MDRPTSPHHQSTLETLVQNLSLNRQQAKTLPRRHKSSCSRPVRPAFLPVDVNCLTVSIGALQLQAVDAHRDTSASYRPGGGQAQTSSWQCARIKPTGSELAQSVLPKPRPSPGLGLANNTCKFRTPVDNHTCTGGPQLQGTNSFPRALLTRSLKTTASKHRQHAGRA